MFIVGSIRSGVRSRRARVQAERLLAAGKPPEIARADWQTSLDDPTAFYVDCFRYYHFRLDPQLKAHRAYFELESRGFGEAAFHVMWLLLFRELRPKALLEIGVYRGQTLSLAALLQRELGIEGHVVGISPFNAAPDTLCRYKTDVPYQDDTLANFRHFKLPPPELVAAYSTDERAVATIERGGWDCVYIDGNHDYEVVRADWENTTRHVAPGGIVVLDDAGSSTSFKAPSFATRGLPGPSRLATEVGGQGFVEILQVGHNRVFQRQS